jgi:lipopolysaccharide export system protein LptC
MWTLFGHNTVPAASEQDSSAPAPVTRIDPAIVAVPAGKQGAANHSADDAELSGTARSKADFDRAFRHSGRVRVLRRLLPIAGFVAIVAILVSLFISNSQWSGAELGGARIEAGKLVMDSPSLTGTDSNKRPYSLHANRAIQDTDNPERIALEGIEARLPMDDINFATVSAGNGIYDADKRTLLLGGNIVVNTDDGMHIRMQDAHIDIESGAMRTRNPVEVDTGEAHISAHAMTVEDGGKTIIFEDRVRMTVQPASLPAIGAIGNTGRLVREQTGDNENPAWNQSQ